MLNQVLIKQPSLISGSITKNWTEQAIESLTEIAANVQSEKLIILLTARCQKLLKYLS